MLDISDKRRVSATFRERLAGALTASGRSLFCNLNHNNLLLYNILYHKKLFVNEV